MIHCRFGTGLFCGLGYRLGRRDPLINVGRQGDLHPLAATSVPSPNASPFNVTSWAPLSCPARPLQLAALPPPLF
jgi:hypothetical protein